MKLKPIEASIFKTLPTELKEQLQQSGVVPVNDVFLPFWHNTNKINLLYGSYGSGKSVFIVDNFINHALEDKYFRCYYGRKVLEDVRGSVHKTITDQLEERRVHNLFDFSIKPNGSMNVICKETKNEFIPFGANDSASLKSIKDPTHFFLEEMDQFTFKDFGVVYSRLRTQKALTQLYGAFNTERVFQSHWIRTMLFDGEFSTQATKLLCNYTDNHFIDQADYFTKLQLMAGGNQAFLNAISKGAWGMIRTGAEFWTQFSENKHVKDISLNKQTTIHVSLDENVNPYVTQTLWQIFPDSKLIRQVDELLCESPKNNAPKAAKEFIKWLEERDYNPVIFIYGDPSASKRSTIDENSASFYDKYTAELRNAGYSVVSRVKRSAPEVASSADFINTIYESSYGGWSIEISSDCLKSIEDYILVKASADGHMAKPKTKDPDTGITYEPQGHISDAKRYFLTTVLESEFNAFKSRKSKIFGYSVS
jgi:hypothetical protein